MSRATKWRTHGCGDLRAADAQKPATIAGFVDRCVEEKGGTTAIDLRDGSGTCRVILAPNVAKEVQATWAALKPGDVVQAVGAVALRATKDPQTETGEVEVVARTIALVSESEPLPPAFLAVEPLLEERLRHRPLDLRRPVMQRRLAFRAKFLQEARTYLAGAGFLEVDTPLLGRWTSDMTQSYIVAGPPGKVFALPGTTLAAKQLLIAGGVERYFQVARCFRREDKFGPERQPEFSVLDFEMAYVDETDVMDAIEGLLAHLHKTVLGTELKTPIPRLTWDEAIAKYGTDRPDLRLGSPLADLTALAGHAAGGPLLDAIGAGGGVRAFKMTLFGRAKDEELDRLGALSEEVAPGTLTWLRVSAGQKLAGPAVQLFPGPLEAEMLKTVGANVGDVVVVAMSRDKTASAILAGAARKELGDAHHVGKGKHAWVWVTQFPFYRFDPRTDVWEQVRQPFTQPRPEHVALLETDKHAVRTKGFDLVLDGAEIGAGGIRNHDMALQRRIFEMFEYRDEEIERRFGPVLDAFRFGVPPHGGMAIGLDRLLAKLQGLEAIDDVIAFPKSYEGVDLLFDAPAPIDPGFLRSILEP